MNAERTALEAATIRQQCKVLHLPRSRQEFRVSEASGCRAEQLHKQLPNYRLRRSGGRSQGQRKPARAARGPLTACRRGGYPSLACYRS